MDVLKLMFGGNHSITKLRAVDPLSLSIDGWIGERACTDVCVFATSNTQEALCARRADSHHLNQNLDAGIWIIRFISPISSVSPEKGLALSICRVLLQHPHPHIHTRVQRAPLFSSSRYVRGYAHLGTCLLDTSFSARLTLLPPHSCSLVMQPNTQPGLKTT